MCNSFFYLRGGAERCFFDLMNLLISNGHQVIPFCMANKKNKASKYSEYFVKNIDYPKKLQEKNSFGAKLSIAKRLFTLMKQKTR